MKPLKNWDNETWISSKKYILQFNKFLKTQIKINKNTIILDIGCGRGNIIGNLESKHKFYKKPIGVDIIKNNNIKKNIIFKQIDAINYLKNTKKLFDLILIKQTIHLLNQKEIKRLINLSKKNLSQNGKILIFTLDTDKNELPTFKLMKTRLTKSLKKDKKILKLITKLYPCKKSKFIYKVNISKKKYLKMVKNRYISTLLSLTNKEIQKGMNEISYQYKDDIKFSDKLTCVNL